MRLLPVLALFGCNGPTTDSTPDPTGTDTADSSTPTGESGTDTGTPEPVSPRLRALHVGATVPPQDMLGNGNPGQPPLVDLAFGQAWPASGGWAMRPANTYTFGFYDDGSKAPWTEFPFTLADGGSYSMVVFGTAAEPQLLALEDAVIDVPKDRVRIRWTHAAPSLADRSLVLREATNGAQTYAAGAPLAYGGTVEADEAAAAIQLWVDLDGDVTCDVGEAFQVFDRAAGDYFHVLIAEDEAGALFLQGHTRGGAVPTRPLAATCP